jgi:hypothetical protein
MNCVRKQVLLPGGGELVTCCSELCVISGFRRLYKLGLRSSATLRRDN